MRKIARELLSVARELEVAMEVTYGEKGLDKSWQMPFPKSTECCRCGGPARIAFVAHECMNGCSGSDEAVWRIHENEGAEGGLFWPHDAVAVAVYLCGDCLEPTALFNQA